jgi:hypothetical protein
MVNSGTNSSETGKKVAKIFREQKREFKSGNRQPWKMQAGQWAFILPCYNGNAVIYPKPAKQD